MKTQGNVMYTLAEGFVPAGRVVDEADAVTYDVMRLIDGVPLFFAAHLARVDHALEALGEPSRGGRIEAVLPEFIRQNGGADLNTNLKILAGGSLGLALGLIPHAYPEDRMYREGVRLVTVSMVRENPELKVWNHSYKLAIADALEKTGAHEALLVDEQGRITEGSRSNVFAVRGNRILTPGSGVLPGITRRYVNGVIRDEGIDLVETDLPADGLGEMDGLFITGTSPKVLPARQVDDVALNPDNPLVRQVMAAFDRLIDADLRATRERLSGGEKGGDNL